MRFENRIAVVAGGTKGIGRAVTLALAKEGAIVEAWGRDAAAMEEVKRAAEAFEGKVSCAKVHYIITYHFIPRMKWSIMRTLLRTA